MADVTRSLQDYIDDAHQESLRKPTRVQGALSGLDIELKKGDYPVQQIVVPKETSVTIYSKDKVRLLYIGKRNRPLFMLQEKCELILKEKLEIYYNTNNVQEAMKLMIRVPLSSRLHVSEGVKFSLFSYKSDS